MMWQPIASAWTMFSSSRGLAHSSSAFGRDRRMSRHWVITGIGSRPVSEMRPAHTDTIAGVDGLRASATAATWAGVMIAVTITTTPGLDNTTNGTTMKLAAVSDPGAFTQTQGPKPPNP